jgi:hypothetical protein
MLILGFLSLFTEVSLIRKCIKFSLSQPVEDLLLIITFNSRLDKTDKYTVDTSITKVIFPAKFMRTWHVIPFVSTTKI